MALVRWEPAREIHSLQQEMNRLFSSFFDVPSSGAPGNGVRRWVPAMDLVETDDHFVLTADLPGLTQDDVTIEVEDRVLTVSGERRSEHQDRREGFVRLERATGRFSRSLTMPEGVDAGAITASFDKGVLEVLVPKPEERKPQRVAITVDAPPAIEGEAHTS